MAATSSQGHDVEGVHDMGAWQDAVVLLRDLGLWFESQELRYVVSNELIFTSTFSTHLVHHLRIHCPSVGELVNVEVQLRHGSILVLITDNYFFTSKLCRM